MEPDDFRLRFVWRRGWKSSFPLIQQPYFHFDVLGSQTNEAFKQTRASRNGITEHPCIASYIRSKPVRFTCQNVKRRAKIGAKQRMQKVRREFQQNGSFRSACIFTCHRTEQRAPSTSNLHHCRTSDVFPFYEY